ncbi:YbaB/EbfC family nucleoid-associated protein [Candidatus Peregrinibacteria bacterium]|nr:YbaB/EbfC family nucleoid-associated protein [Candidatus Peregrinibacteria bacterium]
MVSWSKARDMFRLQREAKKIRKELKNIHVEEEAQGVKVIVTGEQKVHRIEIGPDVPRENISELLTDALNRALAKAQVVSADKMQGVMGEMGLGMGNE